MGFDLTDQGERLRNQRELRFRVRWRRNNAEHMQPLRGH